MQNTFTVSQILTSVKEITPVTWMLPAITPLDHMYVNVSQVKITWLWWWLPLRLSKRQSPPPTTVLLRTTLTRTIKLHYYLKIITIKFGKIIKILWAPWLVKKQPLIAPINPWKIEVYVIKVTDHISYRFISVVNVFRCWKNHSEKKRKKKEINRLQLGITNFLESSQHPAGVISPVNW